jgi:hypothetical protein
VPGDFVVSGPTGPHPGTEGIEVTVEARRQSGRGIGADGFRCQDAEGSKRLLDPKPTRFVAFAQQDDFSRFAIDVDPLLQANVVRN